MKRVRLSNFPNFLMTRMGDLSREFLDEEDIDEINDEIDDE